MTVAKGKGEAARAMPGWRLVMALILLLAFANGAQGIWRTSISGDELNTLSNIGAFETRPLTLNEVIAGVRQRSADHTPLYFVTAAAWSRFAGFSQFSMRYLSLLYGVLAIAWLYRLALEMADRRTALLACLLMSGCTLSLWYFAVMRMYSLILLLCLAHAWLYWRLLRRTRSPQWSWLFFILTAAALLYTQPLAVTLIVGLGVYHLLFVERSGDWRRILLGWALAGATLLPWMSQLLQGTEMQQARNQPLLPLELVESVGLFLVNGQALLWLPLMAAIGFGLRGKGRRLIVGLLVIALVIFACFAVLHARFQMLDYTRMRYFLPMFPFALVAFAICLRALPAPRLTIPAFTLIWLAAGVHFSQPAALQKYRVMPFNDYRYPPLQNYVLGLSGKVGVEDYLLGFTPSNYVNWEHPNLAGDFAAYYLGTQLGIDGVFLHESDRKYRLKNDVNAILKERPHLLLAHDPRDPPPNYELSRHFIEEAGFVACPPLVNATSLMIRRVQHPVLACEESASPLQYENGIRLIDRVASYDADSDLIQVLLWWEIPDDSMRDDYNISLQLFASDGEKAAQVDRHLDESLSPWGVVDMATASLAPGDYQLALILYERGGGPKLSAKDEATVESGKLMPLLELEVAAR